MRFTRFRTWLDVVTKVAAIVGGLFVFWQYMEAKQDARIVRTFALVDGFQKEDLGKAQAAISAELRKRLVELSRIHMTPMPPNVATEVHAKLLQALVLESRGGQGLGTEIALILGQFDMIHVCIEKFLCDAKTAQAFLGNYARTFWNNFRPYIEQQSKVIPGYGDGLRRFVAALPRTHDRPDRVRRPERRPL